MERLLVVAMFFVTWMCSATALAQPAKGQPQPDTQKPAPPEVKVAAKVNGEAIFVAEVEREVQRVLRDQAAHPDAVRLLQAQAVKQVVDRCVILNYLQRMKQGASSQDIDTEVDKLAKQLKQTNKTLADHTKALGLDASGLRRQFAWYIGWNRYLERYMTDENLAKYFEKNRREFDGTQIHAAHILFKVETERDAQALNVAIERAASVRRDIMAGKLTFEEAAAKYSSAPTAKNGGDIGLIGRHDPMPEAFSRVAFSLERGGISEPVVTAFGVHLVRCLEIVPGKKTWQEARPELEQEVAKFLYSWIADRERGNATIEYTGALPHFRPGTEEIVP